MQCDWNTNFNELNYSERQEKAMNRLRFPKKDAPMMYCTVLWCTVPMSTVHIHRSTLKAHIHRSTLQRNSGLFSCSWVPFRQSWNISIRTKDRKILMVKPSKSTWCNVFALTSNFISPSSFTFFPCTILAFWTLFHAFILCKQSRRFVELYYEIRHNAFRQYIYCTYTVC